ncbi:MAG TPA: DUF3124 domain-containing protein [Bacteroidales bacterium]|nr:DUF3124 domain-containing protein [Bacteroidales bacterium]
MNRIILSIAISMLVVSCMNESRRMITAKKPVDFDRSTLNDELKPEMGTDGQLVYLPVYSNIPYLIDTGMFDMSAFVAIHNTDLTLPVTLTQVLYFDQDGKLVDNYLKEGKMQIAPLATKNFYIPYEDKSGTGANFLIEWVADTLVNEPLIESVTLCLKPNNTLSIMSQGKVIRQNR